jgi:hypothetical protein
MEPLLSLNLKKCGILEIGAKNISEEAFEGIPVV